MHTKTARYIVGIRSNRLLYEGDSRLVAWIVWLAHRHSGASAFDRRSWVIDPSCWLRGETPEPGYFVARHVVYHS